jgi:hypothetical protein
MEGMLITIGLICLALGIAAAVTSRFKRPIRSMLPILAGIAPWVVMLGADGILGSGLTAWIFIFSGGVLFLAAAVAFLSKPATESERFAGFLSIIGCVMSFVWLIAFLSAISSSHV